MKRTRKKKEAEEFIEFVLLEDLTSSPAISIAEAAEQIDAIPTETLAPSTKLEEMPPVYRELAQPRLPVLAKENRARLQMQTPNRLFFYWSVGANPFQQLNKALGAQTASYTLVLKLVDLKRDAEHLYPAEAEGSWWFDVEADSSYRAEIGFYAPNRPFVRALYSNTVQTPRKSPSPRTDTAADWRIPSDRFARVLEVSGFTEDAFDVAIAGDDHESAEAATRTALGELVDDTVIEFETIPADEIRYAMLLLASGLALDALRWKISPALFAILQERAAAISTERALKVLKEHFDIEADEFTEEEFGPAVFGASSINFPKRLKTSRTLPKFSPVSSPTKARQG